MRVLIHLKKFNDWQPVPLEVDGKPVVITPADIAAKKVMPDRHPGQWRMRVEKTPPTPDTPWYREMHITEQMIVRKIIEERCDIRRAGRIFTRKQAIAQVVMEHGLMSGDAVEALASDITHFEVDCDDGPDEALMRAEMAPHHEAEHARRGGKNIDAKDLEAHVKAYMEPASVEDHVTHLHAHFNVKAAAQGAVS
jgi:hypothetical protein